MKRLLIVYNTCGIRGNESSDYYSHAIETILGQSVKPYSHLDFEVLVSAYAMQPKTRETLLSRFDGVGFNFIDDPYPVTITFNQSVLKGIEHWGEFEGYLYLDSGCAFQDLESLKRMYEGFKQFNAGMYAAQVDFDGGLKEWFGTDNLFDNGDFIVPVGKTCNLHCQIFHNELVQYYGRPYVDIFAGHCSESVFSFVCAAMKKNMVISKDVILHHRHLDGQSSSFNPWTWEQQGKNRAEHPYLIPSVMQVVSSVEALELGLGYEEIQGLVMHDPEKYDENGFCKNDKLKEYIKNHLYLNTAYLDYKKIKSEFIYV